MASKPPPRESLEEIGLHELENPNVWAFLGGLASHQLRAFGQVTFVIGATDKVVMANPVHVYLDVSAVVEGEDVEKVPAYRYLRPVIGSGRPQYVAMRDGQLWEIEFIDEEPSEEAGS